MTQHTFGVCAATTVVRALAVIALLPLIAFADNVLRPGTPVLDRPTLTALGIKLPLTGDDNFNASVAVRYRKQGTSTWSNALPLFRVHPETVGGYTIAPQFSGSIFDLRPATTYEIELRIADPDGAVDQTLTLSGTTRTVPRDPVAPRNRSVAGASQLSQALSTAQAGDIINLADGVYTGTWSIFASGTEQNPIVIRGASRAGTILDGANCTSCNILEVYGSWVHVERLTMRNAQQALRFQGAGARGNVLRRVHVKNTLLGMNSRSNQLDFYIADNIFEGRLQWPLTYPDDGGIHGSDDGIRIEGFGHVVAHNRISGYGDAMKIEQPGARAIDFYGNEVLWSYDNGLELDQSEGNARALRNRFTNTHSPISVQPVNGGPAYIVRNIAVNQNGTPVKFHGTAVPRTDPNGVFVYHNTFVSPYETLSMQAGSPSHYFELKNNLFVGPSILRRGVTTDWFGLIDHGTFDYNGYWPNGYFCYLLPSGYIKAPSFSALQSYGIETHGTLLGSVIFASGLVGPASHLPLLTPQDVSLASSSTAADRGTVLANVNDGYTGAAPDLGAIETGCPQVSYGPRPVGVDESNQPFGCSAAPAPSPASATTITVGVPAALTYSTADQNITLTASVSSAGGAVNGGDVNFLVNGVSAGRVPLANGSASLGYRIPARTAAGTQLSFTAQYTGTATFAASSTTAARVVTIAKAQPVITWNNPANINQGTALSGAQLNATANVPGTFSYNPPAGTVLPAGDGQALNTTFTPSDVNYKTATATVRINVRAATTPAGAPNLTVSYYFIRMGTSKSVIAYITLRNTGTAAASNLVVTSVRINSVTGTPSTVNVGTLAAGGSRMLNYSFANPGATGSNGTLYVNAAYTGGQLQAAIPVRLP
jgi:hypothetical protein